MTLGDVCDHMVAYNMRLEDQYKISAWQAANMMAAWGVKVTPAELLGEKSKPVERQEVIELQDGEDWGERQLRLRRERKLADDPYAKVLSGGVLDV